MRGPSLGERLRGRFGRKEEDPYESQRETRDSGRGAGAGPGVATTLVRPAGTSPTASIPSP